jgi:23S rRNA pseudouridine2605 synthase
VLAAAGVASRRAAENLISAGRVSVNGDVVRVLGRRVNPATDVIHVDGVRVNVRDDRLYLALNKPRGVLSTMSDERGRPTVGEYVAEREERLFHVGRLDQDSEGLLLLTNDGELANRLMHPRYLVLKTYLAEVSGPVPRSLGRRLRSGVELDDGPVAVDDFTIVDAGHGRALVQLTLHEGRNRIVRRLLAQVGHPVLRLVRTQIGPVRLGHQRPGTVRKLSQGEVGELFRLVGM